MKVNLYQWDLHLAKIVAIKKINNLYLKIRLRWLKNNYLSLIRFFVKSPQVHSGVDRKSVLYNIDILEKGRYAVIRS
jgi:hypothetical protein